MAGQQVAWAPYAGSFGAWSKGTIAGGPPSGTYTGAQAARWAELQDQAQRRRDAKKDKRARRRGRR